MLDEVVAAEGQALVFTQFRAMGEMLAPMLRHELDREVLLLHGGTSAKDRDALVARFQRSDGTAPIFVLSLKAGGIGLNLTAANHVFHYDRWWNPAVENQATDRAFRIGQTRTVQVHKFVVAGTLEEKIDQMIESKSNLADSVIGSGEGWLTELSLAQLREVLTLRPDAVETDSIASVEEQA
jgi:SNF2 family DNA or RNA helicase